VIFTVRGADVRPGGMVGARPDRYPGPVSLSAVVVDIRVHVTGDDFAERVQANDGNSAAAAGVWASTRGPARAAPPPPPRGRQGRRGAAGQAVDRPSGEPGIKTVDFPAANSPGN